MDCDIVHLFVSEARGLWLWPMQGSHMHSSSTSQNSSAFILASFDEIIAGRFAFLVIGIVRLRT
jgi:hypothetical protein